MNESAQLPIILFIILSISLIILVAITIIRAYKSNKYDEQVSSYINNYIDDWYDYLYSGADAPEINNQLIYQRRGTEKIFSTFIHNGTSKEIENRISKYATKEFSYYYRKKLKSRYWGKRINVLNKIAEYKVPGFTQSFTSNELKKMTSLEYLLYLIYLSHFDIEQFKNNFLNGPNLTEYENKKILSRLDDTTITSLLPDFHEMPTSTKYAFLDRVSRISRVQPIAWLESLFEDDDIETRIRALKVIQSIGRVENPLLYIKYFKSSVWEERMLVCRLAPYIGEISVPLLKECANDKNHLVKSAAQNSLKYLYMKDGERIQ